MSDSSEPPITIEELGELQDLELAARGETRDDVSRSTRARLQMLRYDKTHARPVAGSTLEARVSALEAEVKVLRELIEGAQKNG